MISVFAPSPVGFARGAPPANVLEGDQLDPVNQAPLLSPVHARVVCAKPELGVRKMTRGKRQDVALENLFFIGRGELDCVWSIAGD